jgi:hypothetical protein
MFTTGDKVVLYKKSDDLIYDYVKFDKIYEVKDIFYEYISIIVNNKTSFWYTFDNFFSLMEYRKQKINRIKESINEKT